MNIRINFIPHNQQRYETVGDWFYDAEGTGDLIINVSNDVNFVGVRFDTEDRQNLIALHELVEALLCRRRGITQKQVDEFDMKVWPVVDEICREEDEPGDDPLAPYHKEHRFAMIIEHLMAHELGLFRYEVLR